MPGNTNLQAAQREKNDEFYTQLSDIEAELPHCREHFKGRSVYCNCDSPETSNFWRFFQEHFEDYGLKQLTATYKAPDACLTVLEEQRGGVAISRRMLTQGGDFRSDECIQLLRQAEIIVTNPPFSLWREYLALLVEYQKYFLMIGPMNAITYKEVFPLLQGGKLWLGRTAVKSFLTPEGGRPQIWQCVLVHEFGPSPTP